jgi:glycosyltransferase involved in cell wall biosynthesis
MLYYIPIEPLDERYTEQWYRWFPNEFKFQGIEYTIIDGEPLVEDEIKVGTFLDINSSTHYKFTQLQKISRMFHEGVIKDCDVFFVADIEFFGIESIRYLSTLNNINIKMYGFCHAGSYTREDFFSKCEPFAKFFEKAWFNLFDEVFVGSEYHKQQIIKLRGADPSKIIVTGNPYDTINEGVHPRHTKENICILTNRPDYEKRPNITLDVFEILKALHPDWRFVVTTSRASWGKGWLREKAISLAERGIIELYEGLTKKEYLDWLDRATVMTGNSIEENFGYCILESIILNTIPVVPNAYSHPELLIGDSSEFLFNSVDEQIQILDEILTSPPKFYGVELANRYRYSLSSIVSRLVY